MTSHRRIACCRALICVLTGLGALLITPSPASAALTHPFLKTFGSFGHPSGIGIDESTAKTNGNVLLADGTPNNVLDIFGPKGEDPVGVASPFTIKGFAFNDEPSGVAVDNSTTSPSRGDLYVADVQKGGPGEGAVEKYKLNPITEEYEFLESLNASPAFDEPLGVAIDSKGDVFVADFGSQAVLGSIAIVEFSPSGHEIGRVTRQHPPSSIAIDSAGDLFFQHYGEPANVVKLVLNGADEILEEEEIVTDGATGIAIDPLTNTLYVGLGNHINEYGPTTGKPELEHEFGLGKVQSTERIAVNSETGDLYVSDDDAKDIALFGPLAIIPNATTEPASEVRHTTATVTGTVEQAGGDPITDCNFEYVSDTTFQTSAFAEASTQQCSQSAPLTGTTPVSAILTGLKSEEIYHYRLVAGSDLGNTIGQSEVFHTRSVIDVTTNPATAITLEAATLNGSLNPDGLDTHYYFQYGAEESYGQTTAPNDAGSGHSVLSVTGVEVTRLQPHHTYHYRLVAENELGATFGQDETFMTPSTPSIDGLSSEEVTATSAVLVAKIDPDGTEPTFATTCHLEYGPTSSYGISVPCPEPQPLLGTTDQIVKLDLKDLEAVTYHFRLIAENGWGKTVSEDQSFNFYPSVCPNSHVRQETGSDNLPDCRAYELVSPPSQGSFIALPGDAPPAPFATNPARFVFGGSGGSLPGTNPPDNIGPDDYIATRTDAGWVTTYAGLQGNEVLEDGDLIGDMNFDKVIDFQRAGCGFCSPEPVSRAPYLWSVEGTSLGRWPASISTHSGADLTNIGAWQPSLDFSHLAFSSNNNDFAGNGETGLTIAPGSAYDYDTFTKRATVISLLPDGDNLSQDSANTNRDEYINFPGTNNREEETEAYPAQLYSGVSTDGSHILMSIEATTPSCSDFGCTHGLVQLYMRVGDAVSYVVSESELTHESAAVDYVGMTSDGSEVFFTSSEQLTSADTDHSTDLYMWSAERAEQGKPPLTLISKGDNGSGNTDSCAPAAGWTNQCGVVPVIPGRSNGEVGSVGDTSIAHESGEIFFYSPEQLEGSKGILNQENLYVFRDNRSKYVATFAPGMDCEPGEAGECGNGPVGRMDVSPSGNHMAFITNQQLTGYDNFGVDEMYTYEPESGNIVCVSCDPSGAPPAGGTSGADDGLFMANDGRTFFYTPDALVSQDSNEAPDVYEYVEGRPQLITSGTGADNTERPSNRNVGLAGVSEDGVNVYFSTFDTLVSQDRDGQFAKYYDARTNGGFPAPPAYAPCDAADECHGAGSTAPAAVQIGSAASLGSAGNVTQSKRTRHHSAHHKKMGRRRRRAARRRR